jgi:hypothetical protein
VDQASIDDLDQHGWVVSADELCNLAREIIELEFITQNQHVECVLEAELEESVLQVLDEQSKCGIVNLGNDLVWEIWFLYEMSCENRGSALQEWTVDSE